MEFGLGSVGPAAMRRLPRTPHDVLVAIAAGRLVLGATALAAPDLALRPWVGPPSGPGRQVLGRALAGRDLALAGGALLAARRGAGLRHWGTMAALADAGDAVATVLAFRQLPRWGRWAVVAASAATAVAGAVAARSSS